MMENFIVSTPTGRKVLHYMGHNLALMGDAYEPDIIANATERLQLRPYGTENKPVVEPDGIYISVRHLYAIATAIAAKRKAPVSFTDIRRDLFYDGLRPDVAAKFAELISTYQQDDPWWKIVLSHGRYDVVNGCIVPVLN